MFLHFQDLVSHERFNLDGVRVLHEDFLEPREAQFRTEPPLPSFSDPEMVKLYYACSVSPDIGALMEQPLKGAALRNQPGKGLYLQVRN